MSRCTDQGIDIVAESHDGEFWAIQCKYCQETDHSLTWRDISTFTGLAFGVAPQHKNYRPFVEAREFVHSLGLSNQMHWRDFCSGNMPDKSTLPPDIPANPNAVYKDKGWKNLGDWLGTGTIALRLRNYRPFSQARAFARKLKLNSHTEWNAFCRGKMVKLGALPNST